MTNRGVFQAGERVQLSGPKARLHTVVLEVGKQFHTNNGAINHDDVIGAPDGSVVVSTGGFEYLALRPLLADIVMSMPRGAAIVYPKDAAQITTQADIFPGAVVVEAGVGSGALSLWLLRAVGSEGTLHSFERRQEFADIASANVASVYGAGSGGTGVDNWHLHVGDLAEVLPDTVETGTVDRVVLDMLAPWECMDVVVEALAPGGLVVCYVATVPQLSRVVEAMRNSGRFTNPEASETLVRGWHVEGLAVRPDHRMIGHTGFLVHARLLAPGAVLPELRRRAAKGGFDDADVEAWTPGAVGERVTSAKRLRKAARQAEAQVPPAHIPSVSSDAEQFIDPE